MTNFDQEFSLLSSRSSFVINKIREHNLLPMNKKEDTSGFPAHAVAKLLEMPFREFDAARRNPDCPGPSVKSHPNRSTPDLYNTHDILALRRHLKRTPVRERASPLVVSVQNFKGGVAKTTLSVHLAQKCALAGWKTLLVDSDPQASATLIASSERVVGATDGSLFDCYRDGRPLVDVARPTYWANLDLIPATSSLIHAEFLLSAAEGLDKIMALRSMLTDVPSDAYDIIILDSPPQLSALSLNAFVAANAFFVPIAAGQLDFESTDAFLSTAASISCDISEMGVSLDLEFVRFIITRLNRNISAHREIETLLRKTYADRFLEHGLLESSEIQYALAEHKSLLDLRSATNSQSSFSRAKTMLSALLGEMMGLIEASLTPANRQQPATTRSEAPARASQP